MVYRDFESMPFVISVLDIADTLQIGRNAAYELVSSGKIRALKIGNQYRVPREAFSSFVKGEIFE